LTLYPASPITSESIDYHEPTKNKREEYSNDNVKTIKRKANQSISGRSGGANGADKSCVIPYLMHPRARSRYLGILTVVHEQWA